MTKTAAFLLVLIGAAFAVPLCAQEDAAAHFSSESTDACMEVASSDAERLACVGASARMCVAQSGDPLLRIVRAVCAANEAKYWQGRIEAAVVHLSAAFAESDRRLKSDFTTPYPKAVALEEMQAAWRAYVEKTCGFEMALWGWGPSAGVQEVECRMQMTGAQALYLERQPDEDF